MIQNQPFETVKDLVDFYRLHDIPNDEAVQHLRLIHPILYYPSGGQRVGRSHTFATGAPRVTPLVPVSPEHRYSVDSNMPGMRYLSNGHYPDTTPAPPPPAMRRVSTSSHGSMASLNSINSASSTDPASPTAPPMLPIPKPKKEHKFGFMKFLKRRNGGGGGGVRDEAPPIQERGPAPLPINHDAIDVNSPYYSIVKPEFDRHTELIENLRQMEEGSGAHRCECGLTTEEAELPCGWTMHLSQEPDTEGMLFFMGPGNETSWEPPMLVMLQLTADQQDALRSWAEKGRLPMRNGIRSNGNRLPMRNSHSSNGSSNRNSSGSSTSGGSCPGSSSRPISMEGQGEHATPHATPNGRQATEHECNSGDGFPMSTCRL
jgi:hypothetical protein